MTKKVKAEDVESVSPEQAFVNMAKGVADLIDTYNGGELTAETFPETTQTAILQLADYCAEDGFSYLIKGPAELCDLASKPPRDWPLSSFNNEDFSYRDTVLLERDELTLTAAARNIAGGGVPTSRH